MPDSEPDNPLNDRTTGRVAIWAHQTLAKGAMPYSELVSAAAVAGFSQADLSIVLRLLTLVGRDRVRFELKTDWFWIYVDKNPDVDPDSSA
jgi:hypothetical protein